MPWCVVLAYMIWGAHRVISSGWGGSRALYFDLGSSCGGTSSKCHDPALASVEMSHT